MCRLLIAYNVINTLHGLYFFRLDNDKALSEKREHTVGYRTVHYLLSVGVLKEASDAFWELNRDTKLFQSRELRGNRRFQRARGTLERLLDKNNPNSFYRKYIQPVRDDAAFHWRRGQIEACLQQLCRKTSDQWPPLLVAYSSKSLDTRFPIADLLLVRLQPRIYTQRTAVLNVKKVADIVRNLREVTEILVQELLVGTVAASH